MKHHDHDDFGGLDRDLAALARFRPKRRQMLGWLAGASVLPIVGCNATQLASLDGGTSGDSGANTNTCSEIPDETGGPYPGDGSNGPNVLTQAGIVRSDIRSSIGTASGTASGIPLTLSLSVVDSACVGLAGYAVYVWHCNQTGNYSMYSGDAVNENYLRGVQETDASGLVTFTSIFPACYSGRWPHIHFDIYPSLTAATGSANAVKTSQLAMPEATARTVFATSGYEASVNNLAMVSLATDNVFSDGTSLQIPSITGDVTNGITATLRVGISI